MEISALKKHFTFNRTTYYLSRGTKISLTTSLAGLIFSIVLILIYRKPIWETDVVTVSIIWYTIFIAIYSLFFSALSVITLIVLYRRKKQEVWQSIKRETILMSITIGLTLILSMAINWVND